MSYLIVEASSTSELEERVQASQQRGWEPHGGHSVTVVRWEQCEDTGDRIAKRFLYSQTMVQFCKEVDLSGDEFEAMLAEVGTTTDIGGWG